MALMGLLVVLPAARAAYDPLSGGATRFALDRSFLGLLEQHGVDLRAVAPAKLKGGILSFPVSGGKFDPTRARGTVEHAGAVVFDAGKRSLPVKALQLKTTQRRAPLSAKVGGSQLKLATAKDLVVSRAGFGNRVQVTRLSLGAKLATRLAKKLGLKGVLKEGQPLGRALTTTVPETVVVLGKGNASLTLDPGFLAKLDSLFVAVNPIFPAERFGPAFTLPIFGGTIAPDGSLGRLETSGALELLQLGGGQIFWADSWLELAAGTASAELNVQPSPPYAGKAGRVAITELGSGSVAADRRARTIALAGIALTLQPTTAATFNETFAKPQGRDNVFVAGEILGTASFTAQGQ